MYVDQGVHLEDIKKIADKYSLELVHVGHYEQTLRGVNDTPGVFVFNSSMFDGGDYYAGDDIEELKNIMKPSKSSDRLDVAHIYSAYHDGCKFFVTNNPKDFIRHIRNDATSNGRREQLEKLFSGMKIVELKELEKALQSELE